MFELTPQGILGMGMIMVGDLLVLTAILIPAVVFFGILATSISRVSFRQVIGYWILSLVLTLLTGAGLAAKVGSESLAAEPNGLLFGFTNSLVVTLLGIAIFILLACGALLIYIINK